MVGGGIFRLCTTTPIVSTYAHHLNTLVRGTQTTMKYGKICNYIISIANVFFMHYRMRKLAQAKPQKA